jgi:hypothetical protein
MKAKTYPWKQVIWDIAIEHFGLDDDLVEYTDIEQNCKRLPNGLDQELFQAIASGGVPPVNENGLVIVGADTSQLEREAHVTKDGVNRWLERKGYSFRWDPNTSAKRSANKQLRQETAILAALRQKSIDPLALKESRFQQGDKASVRTLVRTNSPGLVRSDEVFDKAWERLRKNGSIRSA